MCCLGQIGGLRPGRGYDFRVRAQNAQGQSPWSQPLQASTAADTPGPPSQPVCSKRTANGVSVKWDAAEQENGAQVFAYRWALQYLCMVGSTITMYDRVTHDKLASKKRFWHLGTGNAHETRMCSSAVLM